VALGAAVLSGFLYVLAGSLLLAALVYTVLVKALEGLPL
jgi:hypothetical protein